MPENLKQARADEGAAIAELLQAGSHAAALLGLLLTENALPLDAQGPARRAVRAHQAAAKRYATASAGRQSRSKSRAANSAA